MPFIIDYHFAVTVDTAGWFLVAHIPIIAGGAISRATFLEEQIATMKVRKDEKWCNGGRRQATVSIQRAYPAARAEESALMERGVVPCIRFGSVVVSGHEPPLGPSSNVAMAIRSRRFRFSLPLAFLLTFEKTRGS